MGVSTLDWSIFFSGVGSVGVISAIWLGWSGRAGSRLGAKAVLQTDMEYIKRGVDEIRVDQKYQAKQLADLSGHVIRVEEMAKSAHKRIDRLEEREG
ncbi:hypothetical protein [Paenibacillus agilis]|uniref:Uncharacterized protein n=1 Tax=Paenibacillus agilis TaxID=3020863 RepID=A0A559IXA9_9BACL|nr:hypothetical protein [Paenibacillus agilis]TVX92236.1 hypothetical protein FPZ44_03675 [Paenibacillus agilis]